MSRVINPNSPGKERSQLMKASAIALRELLTHGDVDDKSRDLVAFISAALTTISKGIEKSVVAWEKRGYWLKADRFQLDWEWAGRAGADLEQGLIEEDWAAIAAVCVKVSEKVGRIKLPKKPRIGQPWIGAWQRLRAEYETRR